MSRAWSQKRARLFESGAGAAKTESSPLLVGRDFKGRTRRRRTESRGGFWFPLLAGAFAAALLLVALRNSILALRYDLDDALARELELMKQQRAATVQLRELRDPNRLQQLAKERGFERPEKVIDLSTETAQP